MNSIKAISANTEKTMSLLERKTRSVQLVRSIYGSERELSRRLHTKNRITWFQECILGNTKFDYIP